MEVIAYLLFFSWIINMLKSKLVNDFEYYTNGVTDVTAQRSLSYSLYYELWVNE